MGEQFRNEFNKININFGETFSELFGGGKASLVLSDELDVLESDIELLEHMGARWLSLDELDSVEWIQADIKAVNYIKESLTF